jgi:hypothetical protein
MEGGGDSFFTNNRKPLLLNPFADGAPAEVEVIADGFSAY